MQKMKKNISIVIATYNASANLAKLLNSIISQKTDNVELIIIDGKSSDNTLSIIKEYEQFINYWISEPDKGIYDAWNKGVKAATGTWIMFLGADDVLLPNALQAYLELISNNNNLNKYDYISAQNQYIDKNGTILKILGNGASWNQMKKNMSAAHVGSLHSKKNLFNQVGGYNLDYRICGDYELLLRKKENLKNYFLPAQIAQMQAGGVSFTLQAIVETFKIRKEHCTVNSCYNSILFIKDILCYKFFKLRKNL